MTILCDFVQVDEDIIGQVRILRQKFDALLQGDSPVMSELTPGQMLLMGFNGLFTQLDADFTSMLDQVAKLSVPDTWRKVDVVKEARSIQVGFSFYLSECCIFHSIC